MNTAIDIVILALLLGNLVVTIGLVRSPAYTGEQKILQCLLVWLIPLVGALLAWSVLREERQKWRADNPHPDGEDASGLTRDHSGHSHGHSGGDGHGGGDGH